MILEGSNHALEVRISESGRPKYDLLIDRVSHGALDLWRPPIASRSTPQYYKAGGAYGRVWGAQQTETKAPSIKIAKAPPPSSKEINLLAKEPSTTAIAPVQSKVIANLLDGLEMAPVQKEHQDPKKIFLVHKSSSQKDHPAMKYVPVIPESSSQAEVRGADLPTMKYIPTSHDIAVRRVDPPALINSPTATSISTLLDPVAIQGTPAGVQPKSIEIDAFAVLK